MTGPHSVCLKWTKPKRPNYFALIARSSTHRSRDINFFRTDFYKRYHSQ